MLGFFRNLASVISAFSPQGPPVHYRMEGFALSLTLLSPVLTLPLEFSFPIDLSAAEGHDSPVPLLCAAQGQAAGSVLLWPFDSSPGRRGASTGDPRSASLFGSAASPCITITSPRTSMLSRLSGVVAQPLHRVLLALGFTPPPRPWRSVAFPFLQSFSSALIVADCNISWFGVVFPFDHGAPSNQ